MLKVKPTGKSVDIGKHNGDSWSWEGYQRGGESLPIPTTRLALWLFLGAVAMLFAAFSSAYLVRMPMPDWHTIPKPKILWLNTLILLLSSGTMQWSWSLIRKGNVETLRYGLLMTGFLGALFVIGQLIAWQKLAEVGVYLKSNPASSFFYLLTGVHGVHLLGGVSALTWVTFQAWRYRYNQGQYLGVELCSVYWHFLSFVWLWIFILIWLK